MGGPGCNMIGGAIMLFLNYFYTDVFGLAPALVGVLLLAMLIFKPNGLLPEYRLGPRSQGTSP